MATFRELLARLGAFRIVEPATHYAFQIALQKKFDNSEGDDPHGRPWHVSFHASSFPGDKRACPRYAVYGLMDVPKGGRMGRWLHSVAEVGKTKELLTVRANRDAGQLCRSNQPGRSSDPDARTEDGKEAPQMGFEEPETWLTGSVDMPLLPGNYTSTHIVEIKSKHESKIYEMQAGARMYDDKHRHQLLCSLGLAHDYGSEAFLHPTEDRVLDQAYDGSIYYVARDTPWDPDGDHEDTFEFYFEHDPAFMDAGREQLKVFRQAFIEGELSQAQPYKSSRTHPNGTSWQWSKGPCQKCELKKICRSDFESGVTQIKNSLALPMATFARPGYNAEKKRAAVFAQWDMNDPLLAS